MCGIIGIVGRSDVGAALYDALTVLQHRGQDAAGIATVDGSKLRLHKANGLVRDVFGETSMRDLTGRYGIGHCRYPTAGSEGSAEAQPFYVNSPFGLALAHNGNLTNTEALRQELFEQDRRHINTGSDSEVLLNVFAHELQLQAHLRLDARPRLQGDRAACTGAASAATRWWPWCSGSAWSPSAIRTASARWCWACARPPTARNTRSPARASRSTCSASAACATWRPARRW